jgi:hypothetical protein
MHNAKKMPPFLNRRLNQPKGILHEALQLLLASAVAETATKNPFKMKGCIFKM